MLVVISILIIVIGLFLIFKLLNRSDDDKLDKNVSKKSWGRNTNTSIGKKPNKKSIFFQIFTPSHQYNKEAIAWCTDFLAIEEKVLIMMLNNRHLYYKQFRLSKRSGGFRTIFAPNPILLSVQKTIYSRILLPVNIHPAAKGFRQKMSIVDNAKVHLGKEEVLKVDIRDFFGSVKRYSVVSVFKKIGYPPNIANILSLLCTLDGKLPQGAPTSPALSNIVFSQYEIDKDLTYLASQHELIYTRYADDLTFSGEKIAVNTLLPIITEILSKSKFDLKTSKTRYLTEKKRKIITGISVSSGEKMTIPKKKKREVRKNVHYILTRGLAQHQKAIASNDPAYLKRLIGYLNFWLQVEPQNQYVIKSLRELKKLHV